MRRILLFTALISITWPLYAIDYYIDPQGHDAADGLTITSAWKTMHLSVNRLSGGDTLWVRGGDYRGKVTFTNTSGSAQSPIRVWAYSNETPVVKGSFLVQDWQYYGQQIWFVTNRPLNSQQVFVDGKLLTQLGWPNDYLATRACSCSDWFYIPNGFSCAQINPATRSLNIGNPLTNMPPGSFYYEPTDKTLYMRLPTDNDDPALHDIEVSTELGVFYDESPVGFLHVKGLAFRHSNTFTYTFEGWPGVLIGSNGTIEDCDIQWCDGSGLTLKVNSKAIRCNVSNNGVQGIACNAFTNMLIQGCTIFSNNYREVGSSYTGGIRIIPYAGATVEDNEVAYNRSSGIWFDTCSAGHRIVVRNNYVHHNWLPPRRAGDTSILSSKGIFIEFTVNAHVYNNLVISNANIGIHLSAARDCRVEHNLIVGTRDIPGGHRAYSSLTMDNPQNGYNVSSNRIMNNILYNNLTDYDVIAIVSNGVTVFDNVFDHNIYHRSAGAGTAFPGSPVSMAYLGKTIYSTMAGWKAATGWDDNSITNNPLLLSDFRLATNSPAIDRGRITEVLSMDAAQQPRPVDGDADGIAAPDIGPYEAQRVGNVHYVRMNATNSVAPYATWETAASHPADALNVAVDGSILVLDAGVYEVSTPLIIDKRLTLRSMMGPHVTALDGMGSHRILEITGNGVVIHGIRFQHGYANGHGGGVLVTGGSATFQQCHWHNNIASQSGGGLFIASDALIREGEFIGNAAQNGGGMFAAQQVYVEDCMFITNTAELDGGGMWAGPSSVVQRTSWKHNSAGELGGAVKLHSGAQLISSLVSSNTADSGGGVYALGSSSVRFSTLAWNAAVMHGGGIYADGKVDVFACSINDNVALGGSGGGMVAGVGASLGNALLVGNSAGQDGGAVFLHGAAHLEFCTIVDNQAQRGGGIYDGSTGSTSRNSIVWDNHAVDYPNFYVESDSVFNRMCTYPMPAGLHHITSPPAFRNPSIRDYRLKLGSPCIDAGVFVAAITNDLDNKLRYADGNADFIVAPDLGAYESHAIHYVDLNSPVETPPYVTWNTASRSLQAAINQAFPDDLILVANGTYPLSSPVQVQRQVTVRSVNGPLYTFLDGGNFTRVLYITHPGAIVEGFTIQRGRSDAGAGAYISRGKLRRSILRNNVATGNLGGAFYYVPSAPRYYCQFSYDSVIHEGGGGIALLQGGIAEDCLIVSNSAVYGGGVLSLLGGNLHHVTIAGNAATNGSGWYARHAGAIRNSIVYGNLNNHDYLISGTNPTWEAVTAMPMPPGNGASADDPLFVAPGSQNYQLSPPSPAIDTAVPTFPYTTDVAGVPRPLAGAPGNSPLPDRGAYEFVHPSADSDNDGLPDQDELIYGTDPMRPDTDGDGVSDRDEILSGTNPLDPDDFLVVEYLLPVEQLFRLQWTGKTGLSYTIFVSTNLNQGFTPYRTNIAALPNHEEDLDVSDAPIRFFMIQKD